MVVPTIGPQSHVNTLKWMMVNQPASICLQRIDVWRVEVLWWIGIDLEIYSHMGKSDKLIIKGFSNVVAINFNMLFSLVKHRFVVLWIVLVLSACRGVATWLGKPTLFTTCHNLTTSWVCRGQSDIMLLYMIWKLSPGFYIFKIWEHCQDRYNSRMWNDKYRGIHPNLHQSIGSTRNYKVYLWLFSYLSCSYCHIYLFGWIWFLRNLVGFPALFLYEIMNPSLCAYLDIAKIYGPPKIPLHIETLSKYKPQVGGHWRPFYKC